MIDEAVVIPVIVVGDLASAVPLARALATRRPHRARDHAAHRGGAGGDRGDRRGLPEVTVGSGTVLGRDQLQASLDHGCRFAVSPGATPALLDAAEAVGLPLLPAAANASQAMVLAERGYLRQKLFPAEPSGGVALLKSLGEPLPQIRFCPTGGIDLAKAPTYLALKNVVCVGGSWVAPKDAVEAGDWGQDREARGGGVSAQATSVESSPGRPASRGANAPAALVKMPLPARAVAAVPGLGVALGRAAHEAAEFAVGELASTWWTRLRTSVRGALGARSRTASQYS